MSFKFLNDHSEHLEGSTPLLNKTYESARFLTSMESLIEAPRLSRLTSNITGTTSNTESKNLWSRHYKNFKWVHWTKFQNVLNELHKVFCKQLRWISSTRYFDIIVENHMRILYALNQLLNFPKFCFLIFEVTISVLSWRPLWHNIWRRTSGPEFRYISVVNSVR